MTAIKLASNENPFGPSPKAVAAMGQTLAATHLYPDNDARELRQKLAQRHGVQEEQVVVSAGSSELIAIICRALLKEGLNAVTSERSFIVYGMATKAAGGNFVEVPMRNNGFDLEGVADAVTPDTRVVFLANPNNPTGTIFDVDATDKFLTRIPGHVLVVLDEAYYDFAQHFATLRHLKYSHSLEYVYGDQNVIVLRTFAKAHGLAGVRVGYGIGPLELMKRLAAMRTTFSVSGLAQAAALAALEDEAHVARAVQNNAAEAERLCKELLKLGIHVAPTWANFLYCEIQEDAEEFADRLAAEGVLVRPLRSWGAPNAIRVTIGTPEQNNQFLSAFQRTIAGSRAL
ncbi:MAG TPA: histidinol-phosphate transaminase [Terriglobales bacterium]|nr:histidinol-phosphate transaminase [Terriglobales bacterium]